LLMSERKTHASVNDAAIKYGNETKRKREAPRST